jgi:signal transduction histidine kinase
MRMFSKLSLRPSDADAAVIDTELQMERKGVAGRVAFAVVGSVTSLLWLAPAISLLYAACAVSWELFARPRVIAWAVASFDRSRLRLFYRGMILVVACFYSVIPVSGLLSGQRIGWYLCLMSFCYATIAGVTYFSNNRWQFVACAAPSFAAAAVAPFVFGVQPEIAIAVTGLNALFVLAALHSARHRAELMESISSQEAARRRAEAASLEKSRFIANISHELRTPLNAIIGYSEMLRESAQEASRTEDQADLDKVLDASRRLLTLINGFLDISRLEAGRLTLNVGWFDANHALNSAVAEARPLARTADRALTLGPVPDLGRGVGDEFRFGQCVINLVAAATRFGGGAILLRGWRENVDGADWFVVETTAAGANLSRDALEHLFDPFGNADLIAGQDVGAGLGLAVARRIARLLGGDVTAANAASGVIFRLSVPAMHAAAAPGQRVA